MFNTLKSMIILLVAVSGSSTVLANDLKEGMDYNVAEYGIKKDNNVRVYFSFRCGHCATMDPIYAEVSSQLPSNVSLTKIPVFSSNDETDTLFTKGFAVAQMLGLGTQYTHHLFIALRENKAPQCVDTLAEFVAKKLDIEPVEFKKQMMSPKVHTQLAEYVNNTEQMSIRAVPTVIVGNYLQVTPKRVTSFKGYKTLISNVVNMSFEHTS
ncbi:thioredoxin domain-containing protein [Vibrio penaeicida]|uniref:Thiol:disulfide interchange protein n=1 Tax=Vibrio penaeicida TaxID=104609 RepID=A0AAV5P176_9VIBR|nr:DsbA family protein [Vibrio penaeicida]RTZ21812.1 hypothetical protein EKN09_17430 [Vibrio penaeicida]GLQ76302.1 hypothetical protein GCM10007932_56650 [Vibrio penaeicida]